MRYVRVCFDDDETPVWACLTDEGFALLAGAPWERDGQRVVAVREEHGGRYVAPCAPSKVVCVGRNYAAHARELGNALPAEPLLFLKPPSSIIGPGEAIVRPVHMSDEVHHEGELAVVLGSRLRHATLDEARAAVFGYTIANDVTARDVQRAENKFSRAKGFDTFCPLGPALIGAAVIPDAGDLELEVRVNGELRQRGRTSDMVFSIPTLLSYISRVMTLEPGDVVLTGTPEGVGPLVAGDRVEVSISGLGTLESPVVDDRGQR